VLVPLAVARIDTTVSKRTLEVLTVNVALVEPTGMRTEAGTLATLLLLLANATVTPALLDTFIVAVVLLPPRTDVDANVSDIGTGGGGRALTPIAIGAEVDAAPSVSVTVKLAV
jgi:hypothetical protein